MVCLKWFVGFAVVLGVLGLALANSCQPVVCLPGHLCSHLIECPSPVPVLLTPCQNPTCSVTPSPSPSPSPILTVTASPSPSPAAVSSVNFRAVSSSLCWLVANRMSDLFIGPVFDLFCPKSVTYSPMCVSTIARWKASGLPLCPSPSPKEG